ncbi:MAG: ABC transporter ATP-binding protein [Candidatus Shapirobacteria bacterium]|jgi:lipopolysaccharide transport system ATP-binding protein
MSDTIIKVENLGKKYQIGAKEPYYSLRDQIANLWNFNKKKAVEEFWALKDVNFEVKRGEAVGIIGRNGAGKSTLLKILSQITPPTTGKITMNGRVASLLEVGTGFNQELTGRENIFLNGAILGLSRKEIRKKFDEIVAFSEIEKFLDTPVKRYSSGMYVRLAFAIAANLEPDILIVDEVLAVGDAQFQKKCLGKMDEVSKKEGRTVLFVSHNMGAIEKLCKKVIVLDQGNIKDDTNNVLKAIKNYSYSNNEGVGKKNAEWLKREKQFAGDFIPLRYSITNEKGQLRDMPVRNDDDIWIQIEGECKADDLNINLSNVIYDADNNVVFVSTTYDGDEDSWPKFMKGKIRLLNKIPKHFLNQGEYRIVLTAKFNKGDWIIGLSNDCPTVNLEIQGGLSNSPYWIDRRMGMMAPILEWKSI